MDRNKLDRGVEGLGKITLPFQISRHGVVGVGASRLVRPLVVHEEKQLIWEDVASD